MKHLRSSTLAAAVALTLSGLFAPAQADTLVVGTTQVPRHFNGAIQSGIATFMASAQIFASPLRYDANWTPQPYLAKSWEVADDGLSVTLHLVEGATFHDGVPITSEDVKFSIMTIKANHPFQTMLAPVEDVETPDPLTAVIKLSKPHPALLLAMSPALMPIIPEHIYGEGDIQQNPANLAPVGSGPFKFVEYKQGEYYKLAKNEHFFLDGLPKMDEVIVQIIGDSANLVLATERGDIDMVPFLSGVRDVQRLEKAENVEVSDAGYDAVGALNWIAFNTKKAPFDNPAVRQAIGYATNKDFILQRLLGGVAKDSTGPITGTSPLATEDVEKYAFDLDKAKALLDEAGLTPDADGIRLRATIDYIPGMAEIGRNVVEYMRTQLKQVGIELEVRTAPDFPTWAQRISNYDFDMTEDSVYNWGDPVIGVDRTYISSNIRKGVIWSNTQQYSNAKVDELLAAAAIETDQTKRAALYKEFQQIVVADAPILYINEVPFYTAYKKGLTHLPDTIWGAVSPWDEVEWSK
ncbi:ABC transporter substrate-binding protein [Pseudooceanicola spongiae]|uniref:ABC transporter substrate-binding protein n=1 Tax=Pseudooceanicola spongiae TaxID=2613965 RepID=A0A7L9WRF3_9RHOB|nr:ABC transporter substrate-binding protein [Pseudooceanicola spongiae]QOL82108.1 ABC transporter substrate-binding protein [Pseudooceanicola spongiae]